MYINAKKSLSVGTDRECICKICYLFVFFIGTFGSFRLHLICCQRCTVAQVILIVGAGICVAAAGGFTVWFVCAVTAAVFATKAIFCASQFTTAAMLFTQFGDK